MEKEYTVIVNQREDLPDIEAELTASTGGGPIPSRSVGIANPRPGSKIQTHFMLTDEEAEALRADPRIRAVEIPPDQRDDISIGLHYTQEGTFQRASGRGSDYVNWGLRRCVEATNTYANSSTISGGYQYAIDGTGVDVVIQDSGIEPNHPEWEDANGTTRLQQIDWYTESGLAGTQSVNHYRDFDGHGSHCAGIAAGKTYGWAKNSRIYSQKLGGLEGPGDSGGIPIADAFDAIRLWHNAKAGSRPTVVNMSWGYGATVTDNPTSGNYRGTAWTYGVDYTTRAELMAATGVSDTFEGVYGITNPGLAYFRVPSRVASVDAEIEDMITDGIHICIAAGNNWHKADVSGGADFNNTATFASVGTRSYHQGSSPLSPNAFMVGNIDSTQIFDTTYKDRTALSSTKGPGVNIWAPGTNIVSVCSNTNDGYTTIAYPGDASYKIMSISGTSMASPQVCGVVALYAQMHPTATPAQMKTMIENDSKSVIYNTGSDTDYENVTTSLFGSNPIMLYSRYGKQPAQTTGAITFSGIPPVKV